MSARPVSLRDGPVLPHVEILPEVGFAAIKAGEHGLYAAYALLRGWDRATNNGRGIVARADALLVVQHGRGVQRRQAERLLQGGDGRYWEILPRAVRLRAFYRVFIDLGVSAASRAHLVPAEQLQGGVAQIRATLMAAVYRVDDDGAPLARQRLADITGVPVSTQRRYDARLKASTLVGGVSVSLGRFPISYVRGVVWANRHLGFFVGSQGDLMRRHGNLRRANHLLGIRRASARLKPKARSELPSCD